jgi:hypothetical protein
VLSVAGCDSGLPKVTVAACAALGRSTSAIALATVAPRVLERRAVLLQQVVIPAWIDERDGAYDQILSPSAN